MRKEATQIPPDQEQIPGKKNPSSKKSMIRRPSLRPPKRLQAEPTNLNPYEKLEQGQEVFVYRNKLKLLQGGWIVTKINDDGTYEIDNLSEKTYKPDVHRERIWTPNEIINQGFEDYCFTELAELNDLNSLETDHNPQENQSFPLITELIFDQFSEKGIPQEVRDALKIMKSSPEAIQDANQYNLYQIDQVLLWIESIITRIKQTVVTPREIFDAINIIKTLKSRLELELKIIQSREENVVKQKTFRDIIFDGAFRRKSIKNQEDNISKQKGAIEKAINLMNRLELGVHFSIDHLILAIAQKCFKDINETCQNLQVEEKLISACDQVIATIDEAVKQGEKALSMESVDILFGGALISAMSHSENKNFAEKVKKVNEENRKFQEQIGKYKQHLSAIKTGVWVCSEFTDLILDVFDTFIFDVFSYGKMKKVNEELKKMRVSIIDKIKKPLQKQKGSLQAHLNQFTLQIKENLELD